MIFDDTTTRADADDVLSIPVFDDPLGAAAFGTHTINVTAAQIGSIQRLARAYRGEGWLRFDGCSVWSGPHLLLVVLQGLDGVESWRWTARGWREPDGWSDTLVSREAAETAALRFYLQKDE